jgi:hypothetical protein
MKEKDLQAPQLMIARLLKKPWQGAAGSNTIDDVATSKIVDIQLPTTLAAIVTEIWRQTRIRPPACGYGCFWWEN